MESQSTRLKNQNSRKEKPNQNILRVENHPPSHDWGADRKRKRKPFPLHYPLELGLSNCYSKNEV
jgi:hypothetical protein